MRLYEGKNNWINFGSDQLTAIELEYDGQEFFLMRFVSEKARDWCEVILDWIEEIKAFRLMREKLREERAFKVYPDDWRGIMIRGAYLQNEVELNFLKNYQAVRVIMKLENGERFWMGVDQVLAEPGRVVIDFSQS